MSHGGGFPIPARSRTIPLPEFFESMGFKFAVVAIAFLVANGAFVYLYFPPQHETDALDALRREMRHVTSVVATSLAPALDFNDPEAVAAQLSALGRVPEVFGARVEMAAGTEIGSFGPPPSGGAAGGGEDAPTGPRRAEEILEPILSPGGSALGRLSVRYSLDSVFVRSEENRRAILVFTLLIVLANGVAMSLVSRQIARPLRTLTRAAQKISGGNFALKIEATSRDEVGELTESFNVMTAYLLESRRMLEQHAEHLEALVTERTRELSTKNAELILQTYRAEEANRLKSEFLANMSHELRTPLSSIIGFLSLILEGICDDERERMELLKDAHRSSLHLLSLINYLLDLTKIEAGRLEVVREPVDLEKEFAETERLLGVQAKARNLELSFATEDGLPDALADSERVRQVLINLVGNAIKFTHRGSVMVTASRSDRDTITIDVVDTGIGIPKDRQPDLFQKFVQGDGSQTRRYGGTGLGLALSKSLVELMGGTISLESAGEGMGTHVAFTLPTGAGATADDAQIVREAQTILADGDPTAPLVLIVDGDPAFARQLYRIVRGGGFRALIGRTPEEALEMAREFRPTAMTVELAARDEPGARAMTGLDLIQQVAALDRRCRIIAITDEAGATGALLQAAGRDHAPIPILSKPVTAEALIAQLGGLERPVSGPGRRILVADDDASVATIVERVTRSQGTLVTHARNGLEALALLESARPPFDLVLLDLDMPELDGFGVLREIARTPENDRPEILVVTNYPELASGRDGHLLRTGHVWGLIPKSRLGEDPDILNRALARIERFEEARCDAPHTSR